MPFNMRGDPLQRRQFLNRVFAGTGSMLIAGCSQAPSSHEMASEVRKRFGGEDSLKLLIHPGKVQAFRLRDSEARKTVDDFEIVGKPVQVPAESAAKLGQLLSDGNSYLWGVTVSCTPDYGVRVEFARDDRALDVLFCFRCKVLATYVDGKQESGAIFDPIHEKLAKLIKPLFPNDPVIQHLCEKNPCNAANSSKAPSLPPDYPHWPAPRFSAMTNQPRKMSHPTKKSRSA